MPGENGVVRAFQFNIDCYEEMEGIYVGILQQLGVQNPYDKIGEAYSSIPLEKRNGLMFGKMISKLFESDDDRRAKALEAFEKIKDDRNISPYIKAYLAEMAGAYIPYDTVITGGRMVGGDEGKNGKSLQMGCGEGKTGVLSTAAYAILQSKSQKKQVFLTSSTELLAAEALDKIDFYELVGLAGDLVLVDSKGITRPRMENGKVVRDEKGKAIFDRIDLEKKNEIDRKRLLKEAYDSKLVISDNVTLMQDSMNGYLEEPTDKKRELLADEADFVLLDSYRPLQKTEALPQKEIDKRVEQRKYAYNLLEQVKKQMPEGLFVKDDSNQYVDFTKEGRKLIVQAIRGARKDLKIDPNTLYDYVYDALVVDTVYKEDRDYQILNNGKKIVSEDRASGVGIDLPQGVAQALEIKLQQEGKYRGPITPERRVVDLLNTQTFFKKYFNGTRHFISGTLGAESKDTAEELKNFGVSKEAGDIYEIAPKEERRRDDRETKFYKGAKTKRKAIIASALKELEQGKPVLIGTVSEKEIKALREHLKNQTENSDKKIRVLEYTAASEEIFAQDKLNLKSNEFEAKYGVSKKAYESYESLIKNESGKANTITLGTNILGRGTTIKTSKEVNDAGGIHVIVDGVHETSDRNPEQYLNRTSRGDNNGSTQIFFCRDDIPEEIRKDNYKDMDPDEVYKEVYDKINARSSNIRMLQNGFMEKTQEKKDEIWQMPFLSEIEKRQVIALLSERYVSITTRSCGVSEQFQDNIEEYGREIDAFAKLYVAKYHVTDEKYLTNGEFDEVKWLEDNGYEDIAVTHMPFMKSKENEIFKKAGMKQNEIKKLRKKEKERSVAATQPKTETQEMAELAEPDQTPYILDEIMDSHMEQYGVEMVVAEPEVVKEAVETPIEPTIEKQNSRIELGNINIDFNKKDLYGQLVDLKEAQLNEKTDMEIQSKYSAMNLLGLKNVVTDSKFNLAMSKIKELTSTIMRIFKVSQKNVAPVTQDAPEVTEVPDTPEDRE